MKKKKTLIIAIAAILVVAIAVAAVVFMKTAKKKEAVTEIALVTDVGTIDDESFNQACWQGVEAYATANNFKYSTPLDKLSIIYKSAPVVKYNLSLAISKSCTLPPSNKVSY